jgi:renalase
MKKKILVIGAGMTGLAAARSLQQAGQSVVVLDKGRGVGGRMATRRINNEKIDHGAQYFSAKSLDFSSFIDLLQNQNLAQPWALAGAQHPRWIAPEGMSSIPKWMAQGLDIKLEEKAIKLQRNNPDDACHILTESGRFFEADYLVCTLPIPQLFTLLSDSDWALSITEYSQLQSVEYVPCLAIMALLNKKSAIPAPGGIRNPIPEVAWIADNNQKGLSQPSLSVTVHASPAFSLQNLERNLNEVGEELLSLLSEWIPSGSVESYQVHRWRYSQVTQPLPQPFMQLSLPAECWVGGDAFGVGNVEGAYLSGLAIAQDILSKFS